MISKNRLQNYTVLYNSLKIFNKTNIPVLLIINQNNISMDLICVGLSHVRPCKTFWLRT